MRLINNFSIYKSLAIFLLCISGYSYGAESDNGDATSDIRANGAKIWMNTCSQCHNARDTNDIPANRHRLVMAHMKLRAQLTEREYNEVLGFLTGDSSEDTEEQPTENNNETTTVKVSNTSVSGEKLYKQSCIACHGANGSGNKIPGVPDFTNHATSPLVKKSRSALINSVEKGTSKMPPKGGNASLKRNEIEAIVDYMIGKF